MATAVRSQASTASTWTAVSSVNGSPWNTSVSPLATGPLPPSVMPEEATEPLFTDEEVKLLKLLLVSLKKRKAEGVGIGEELNLEETINDVVKELKC